MKEVERDLGDVLVASRNELSDDLPLNFWGLTNTFENVKESFIYAQTRNYMNLQTRENRARWSWMPWDICVH